MWEDRQKVNETDGKRGMRGALYPVARPAAREQLSGIENDDGGLGEGEEERWAESDDDRGTRGFRSGQRFGLTT